ncbi:hypothetical protein DYE49_10905 [Treponema rectale]|uniref:Uncharacterized protein n=1 Tax=Treponema rectale TaxID=744512 RepID=A0A840SBN9_9SPIR|nr:hypothetical protein [Treponema rectale]MBB5219177.1 hypothetical protein [Treponema rectale]QOS40926.1 hypothetical protein DYE49_10905 [Treponema rectale]
MEKKKIGIIAAIAGAVIVLVSVVVGVVTCESDDDYYSSLSKEERYLSRYESYCGELEDLVVDFENHEISSKEASKKYERIVKKYKDLAEADMEEYDFTKNQQKALEGYVERLLEAAGKCFDFFM